MTGKDQHIAEFIERHRSGALDPHYAAFFDCFNQGLFFEAHEVLEALWLTKRQDPDGDFYKGLIQIAGAFVHLGKRRLGPGASLLRLARGHLGRYPDRHLGLAVAGLCRQITGWLDAIESQQLNPIDRAPPYLQVDAEGIRLDNKDATSPAGFNR